MLAKIKAQRIEDELIRLLRFSIDELTKDGILKISQPPSISLQPPKDPAHGDLSTNAAMEIARQSKTPSTEVAEFIRKNIKEKLVRDPWLGVRIDKVEAKDPGFINFFLSSKALYDVLSKIHKEGPDYGHTNLGQGRSIQIEFVSANPTGPLTIAHGRQAAVGDALGNILEAVDYRVEREYYINDEGRQIDLLARSVRARYLELVGQPSEFPEEGYQGPYIRAIAEEISTKHEGRFAEVTEEESLPFFSSYSTTRILEDIKRDLELFGVEFDRWFAQSSLSRTGKVKKAIRILKKKGHLYEKDGALWFRSTSFGDDKDRVLVKGDGSLTYITFDIAYHRNKLRRGFDKVIDIWGPDHHGYVARLKSAARALGYSEEKLSILIIQLTTLYKGKEPIPMSTRMGEYIKLSQLTEEVGCDAARFFFLMRKRDSHLDFDLELAKKETPENPVYYVQYAHARISSIREFGKRKVTPDIEASLLSQPEEIRLLKLLRRFPEVVQGSARSLEPHFLTLYLRELAACFHRFYTEHRVVMEKETLTKARLLLADCTRCVLKNGLKLLGVEAPEKM